MTLWSLYKRGILYGEIGNIELKSKSDTKKDVESVPGRLVVPMSAAVDMFLNQIVLTGGIPFAITLPSAPESIDMTKMSPDEIHDKLQKGCYSYKAGRTQNAAKAFLNGNILDDGW